MNRDEFNLVVSTIENLWPRFAAKDWNDANRDITFRKFNCFEVHAVCNALEMQRMDKPDGKGPEFEPLAGKLWGVKKGRSSTAGQARDLRTICHAWGRGKSNEDLQHLAYVATQTYSNSVPKFWPLIESLLRQEPRHPLSLMVCWSMDRNGEPLGFFQNSDEWHEVQWEAHQSAIRKDIAEHGQWWSPQKLAAKVLVSAQLKNAPLLPEEKAVLVGASSVAVMEPEHERAIEIPVDEIPF